MATGDLSYQLRKQLCITKIRNDKDGREFDCFLYFFHYYLCHRVLPRIHKICRYKHEFVQPIVVRFRLMT